MRILGYAVLLVLLTVGFGALAVETDSPLATFVAVPLGLIVGFWGISREGWYDDEPNAGNFEQGAP